MKITSGEENHQSHSIQRKWLWGFLLQALFVSYLLEFSFGVSTLLEFSSFNKNIACKQFQSG